MKFKSLVFEKYFYWVMSFVFFIGMLLSIVNWIVSWDAWWFLPGCIIICTEIWTLHLIQTVKSDIENIFISDLKKLVINDYKAHVTSCFKTITGTYVFETDKAVTKKKNIVGFSMQLIQRVPEYSASNLIILAIDQQQLKNLKTEAKFSFTIKHL